MEKNQFLTVCKTNIRNALEAYLQDNKYDIKARDQKLDGASHGVKATVKFLSKIDAQEDQISFNKELIAFIRGDSRRDAAYSEFHLFGSSGSSDRSRFYYLCKTGVFNSSVISSVKNPDINKVKHLRDKINLMAKREKESELTSLFSNEIISAKAPSPEISAGDEHALSLLS
jgi:hypothetical protein